MTPFSRHVYAVVSAIPPRRALSCRDATAMAGRLRAPRTIGGTLSNLPGDPEVPWRRVVSSVGCISTSSIRPAARIRRALLEDGGTGLPTGGRIDRDGFGGAADDERIADTWEEPDT